MKSNANSRLRIQTVTKTRSQPVAENGEGRIHIWISLFQEVCHRLATASLLLVVVTFSKLFERLVAKQLIDYLKSAKLFPLYQSAYRMNHSTETAVLHVLSEILTAADRGDFSALVLLDLSAAFDRSIMKFCSKVWMFHTVSPDVH